jgi:hypothetical protein
MTKGYYFVPQPAPNPGRLGEELPISHEAYVKAQKLVDEGYSQKSRRYRQVWKTFDEKTTLKLDHETYAAFRELHPDIQQWKEIRERWQLNRQNPKK